MQTRKSRREKIEEKRKSRQPILNRAQRLQADIPKGFVGRWFNDNGSRIQDAKAAGWEFLRADDHEIIDAVDDMTTVIRQRVDKKASGDVMYAYLMVLEDELYEESQKTKAAAIDATVAGMKRGNAPGFGGRIDGNTTYVKTAQLD